MTNTYWLPKKIEVKTNITIEKRNQFYYAIIEQEGYNTIEIECFIDKYNEIDADTCPTDDIWDAVTETFYSYVIANGIKYARKCDKCGKGMNEGYVIDSGEEYYCSDECLHTKYSKEEWLQMYNEEDKNGSDSYWTEWEDVDEYNYVLFDDELIHL